MWFSSFVEGGMRVPLMMSIFRSAFALGRPRDSYSPTSAPMKPFNIPPNSLAVSQPSKSKNLPPTACHSKFNCALQRSLRFSRKVTPQKQKPPNPASSTLFHPPDIHLPRISRFDSVVDLSILNYEFPGTSPFNDPIDTNVSNLWMSNQGPQVRRRRSHPLRSCFRPRSGQLSATGLVHLGVFVGKLRVG